MLGSLHSFGRCVSIHVQSTAMPLVTYMHCISQWEGMVVVQYHMRCLLMVPGRENSHSVHIAYPTISYSNLKSKHVLA